jgi:hypothetical protein
MKAWLSNNFLSVWIEGTNQAADAFSFFPTVIGVVTNNPNEPSR